MARILFRFLGVVFCVAVLSLLAWGALGCNSSHAPDKMGSEKMQDKMRDDKMGEDKMGADKMHDKMGDDKMHEDKMKTDKK